MQRQLFIVFLVLVTCLAGCAGVKKTDVVSGRYGQQETGLGKTAVLSWFAFEGTDASGRDKAEFCRTELARRFSALPEASLVDPGPTLAALGGRKWRDASDMELVAAARAAGVDSVALVLVEDLGGTLSINVLTPYLWNLTTRYSYRMRLLDARTGTLLLDAHRAEDAGGPYYVRGKKGFREDFSKDVAALLGGPGTAVRPTR